MQMKQSRTPVGRRYVQEWDERNPKTHKGYDLRKMPMAALYKEYGLDPMTVDFIGHAIALHRCRPGRCLMICNTYPGRETPHSPGTYVPNALAAAPLRLGAGDCSAYPQLGLAG